MERILYHCGLVPAEWIAAHGFQPCRPAPAAARTPCADGVCPLAHAFTAGLEGGAERGVVFTTACDQMRRLAEVAEERWGERVFLLHVPTSWQSVAAVRGYREELERLGRRLTRWGGVAPDRERLVEACVEYDRRRAILAAWRGTLRPAAWREALRGFHSSAKLPPWMGIDASRSSVLPTAAAGACSGAGAPQAVEAVEAERGGDIVRPEGGGPKPFRRGRRAPIALVGSPLLAEQGALYAEIEALGGEVVLDGTTGGELSLPPPYDRRLLREDPLAALVEIYFGALPDAFRRPNTQLYEWLRRACAERGVAGVILHRQLWCDTWHAEVGRLREWLPVPSLSLETGGEAGLGAHARGRIQAFLENL